MVQIETTPKWKDGDCCYRCRVQFSFSIRKHHCRRCGEVCCSKCASKLAAIPKMGVEKESRVCEPCYEILSKNENGESNLNDKSCASTEQNQCEQQPDDTNLNKQFDEDTELAIALSKSLQETSGSSAKGNSNLVEKKTSIMKSEFKQPQAEIGYDYEEMEPELRKYLDTEYWAKKKNTQQKPEIHMNFESNNTIPSAPESDDESSRFSPKLDQQKESVVTFPEDEEKFLTVLKNSVDVFVNRMKANADRNRSIMHDSSVQTLFSTLQSMHPQLLNIMLKSEEKRAEMEYMQDLLAQLKDSRQALNGLREEERSKRQQYEMEMQRQKQITMNAKLQEYRSRKYNYLEIQRQQCQQDLLEQERNMAYRIEQMRQMQQSKNMQWGPPPAFHAQQTLQNVPDPNQNQQNGPRFDLIQNQQNIQRFNQPVSQQTVSKFDQTVPIQNPFYTQNNARFESPPNPVNYPLYDSSYQMTNTQNIYQTNHMQSFAQPNDQNQQMYVSNQQPPYMQEQLIRFEE